MVDDADEASGPEADRQRIVNDLRESEHRHRVLFETMAQGIVYQDSQGRITDANPAAERLLGLSLDQMRGATSLDPRWRSIREDGSDYPGKEHPAMVALRSGAAASGTMGIFNPKDGDTRWIVVDAVPEYRQGEAHPFRVFVTITDISERKRTENSLRESELRFRTLANSGQALIWTSGTDKKCDYFNDVWYAFTGRSPAQELGDGWTEGVHPDDIDRCIDVYLSSFDKREPFSMDYRLRRHDGEYRWIQDSGCPRYDGQGNFLGFIGHCIDISALKQAQENYQLLFRQMPVGFALHQIILDPVGVPVDYRFLSVNPAFECMTGLRAADVVGRRVMEVIPGIEKYWVDTYGRVALTGEPESFENYAAGIDKHFQVSAFSPKPGQFACMFLDVSQIKRAMESALTERELLDVTLRSIGDGVITTDVSGAVTNMNRVAEDLCGWKLPEAAGRPLRDVFRIVDQSSREPRESPADRVLASGEIMELANHTLLVCRDGSERSIDDSGAPIKDRTGATIGVVLVFRDSTEKQKLADAAQRIDKLDSLGVLAGGIAHDFNNLLSGVFGYLDMAKERTLDPIVGRYLEKALSVFNRAKDLTQQLLTFSKGGAPARRKGELGALIRVNAAFALSGSNVILETEIEEGLWPCDFDASQIGQVLDNILINAKQAMPQGGTVTVRAENAELAGSTARPGGRYVMISVADEGPGIPPELRKRIFDPFFTTKQEGNGLGLATCYSIVKKHDGFIDVESPAGEGSVFRVYLPASSSVQ